MGTASGNPTWQDHPSTATLITAAALENIEAALDWRRVGTGSPEGSVTAPPGVVYTDTSGTNGAWRWLKKTGTGNTGWTIESADTGWRDIGTLIHGGTLANIGLSAVDSIAVGGGFRLRRVGWNVYFRFSGMTVSDTTKHDLIAAIPSGFQGEGITDNRFFPVTSDVAQLPLGQVGMREATKWQFWFSSTGIARACIGSWVTAQAWPTSLPGTAI